MENRQYACKHDGCAKSFMRKEHLSRHEKSHNPANWLHCAVCKRRFNRNDSLQRHIVKHGVAFKQNPSGRSKRACLACRVAKVKCDGTDTCVTCAKKGVECNYGKEDDSQREETPNGGQGKVQSMSPLESVVRPGSLRSAQRVGGSGQMQTKHSEEPINSSTSIRSDFLTTPSSTSSAQPVRAISKASNKTGPSTSAVPPAKARSLVDWTSIQIQPDPKGSTGSDGDDRRDPESQKYLDVYFDQFHHRWPIAHRPSLDQDPVQENDLFDLSMRMVGAWLVGTNHSVQFAVETHGFLVDHLMSRLCQVTSQDRYQQSLPAWICNAALLNIIFGLYYGVRHDREMSRAIVLQNILVSVLRETGLFDHRAAWVDEKKGYFLPLRLVKLEQRLRLAYTLFKLDAYIGILRNQPMSILPGELYFPLPCTFALWNANGLHIWEERHIEEPIYRGSKSMYSLIVETSLDASPTQEQPMLIEDIHLALCAMQSDVWKYTQSGVTQTSHELNSILQKDSLRRRLERLNSRLDLILAQDVPLSKPDFGHEERLPYRCYYGFEDDALAGWQEVVVTRVKDLLFDTVMLYFLSSLHLSVDVRKLTQIAKDRRLSTIEELSEAHGRAREQRLASMKGWTATPGARSALCQSVDVLVAYQNFKNGAATSIKIRTLDPICHAALCVSALIVWAFCKFYDSGCNLCSPGSMSIVELTTWSILGSRFEKEKKAWIESDERSPKIRPQLQGIQFCECNTDYLIALFQACLPDWSIADKIAPGIFKITS